MPRNHAYGVFIGLQYALQQLFTYRIQESLGESVDHGLEQRRFMEDFLRGPAEQGEEPYRHIVETLDLAFERESVEWGFAVERVIKRITEEPDSNTNVALSDAVINTTEDAAIHDRIKEHLFGNGRTDQTSRFATHVGDPTAQWLANKFKERRDRRDRGGKHAARRSKALFGNLI